MFRTLAFGLLALSVAIVFAMDEETEKELKKYKGIIGALTRQIMMQQLSAEESARASGDSGIKLTRGASTGTRPYFGTTHVNPSSVNAMHDHSQNWRTVGMGELVVVLNGVEFRTRHNDFGLRMPHRTKRNYHGMENVPYPDVPPSVLEKPTVQEQVEEMKRYFKSFKDQTPGKLDYRPYFKPVLCYLEGAWTVSTDTIDEPFFSDRHFVDASSWWDLTEKVRYTSYTGRKSNNENYSFLPMKIMNLINNNTEPTFAQWNYRILCAPLKDDIPTKNFRIIDDLPRRMASGKTLEEMTDTRQARFTLSDFTPGNVDKERSCRWCYLDTLMEQIPGKDNYRANLVDNSFGINAEHFNRKGEVLNTGYYHRVYQGNKAGAMGTVKRNRGFNDQNVYMAQTSQKKIPTVKVTDCVEGVCTDYKQRWSYAIPLEIVYLTPLYNWNPYNLSQCMDKKQPCFDAVIADGRNGGTNENKAYDGTRYNIFYNTPEELFMGSEEPERDPADTSKGVVGVLDQQGKVRRVVASGTRIHLPNIPGVGKIRTRYPISPLHDDGNTIFKEVQALKDIVMRMNKYSHMLREQPSGGNGGGDGGDPMYKFTMGMSTRDPPGLHTHEFEVPRSEVESMMTKGTTYEVETDLANGHEHTLVIRYDKNAAKNHWVIQSCDSNNFCWDGHPMFVLFEG